MRNPIFEQIGYEEKTTFWMDFSIADRFGVSAIEDTFKRAFQGWKDNVIFLTELAMVLNHKIWQHYEKNPTYGQTYDKLWRKVDDWAYENLKDDDLQYYLKTTD